MAKARMTRAEAERTAGRIMKVAGAAAACMRKLRITGKKKLSQRQKTKLRACIIGEVGPPRK
jgi:ketosteroid isomerase-like protein